MNRRNFLKSIATLAALPVAAKAVESKKRTLVPHAVYVNGDYSHTELIDFCEYENDFVFERFYEEHSEDGFCRVDMLRELRIVRLKNVYPHKLGRPHFKHRSYKCVSFQWDHNTRMWTTEFMKEVTSPVAVDKRA